MSTLFFDQAESVRKRTEGVKDWDEAWGMGPGAWVSEH